MAQQSAAPTQEKVVNIWYLLRFIKGYWWPIGFTLAFLIASRVASTFDPIWLKKVIDGVGEGKTLQSLATVIGVYFGLRFLSALFDYLRDVIFAPAEMGISKTLSEQLFAHLLRLPISYHTEQKIGGMSRQITRGTRAITFILDFMVINILPTIVELIVTTVLLIKLYNPIYGLVTAGTIVLYTWFTMWSTEKRMKYRVAANEADDEVSSIEVSSLTNMDTIKYFAAESQQMRRYLPATQKRYKFSVTSNQVFALISGAQNLILLVGLGIILYAAIVQTLQGKLTIGDLVALTTYIARLSAPIGVLGFVYRGIKDGLADLDGMAKMLAEPVTVQEPISPVAISKPKGAVHFENLSFQYRSDRAILRNLNLSVKPGERVAIVGASGAGKSTLVKLLFRLFDPTEGAITIDGIDLRQLSAESRQQLLAIVPQDPALFNATMADNLRFAFPAATDKDLAHAVKLASLQELVERLPEGLETIVGERGVKLSGGEKQRLAIARAILRDPAILVFDEATSSLDTKSERAIQKALDVVAKGRTTLAIAHRLSTIVDYDRIVVLKDGELAEQGTHAELLAKNGLYAQYWNLQLREPTTIGTEEVTE